MVTENISFIKTFTGVQCLKHLVENVTPTELSWYGRTDLIVEALNRNLVAHCATSEDLEMISSVCLCWFALLQRTEDPGASGSTTDSGKPNGWDRLAKVFIYKLEMASENSVQVRYARHLAGLIDGLGHRSLARSVFCFHPAATYLFRVDSRRTAMIFAHFWLTV